MQRETGDDVSDPSEEEPDDHEGDTCGYQCIHAHGKRKAEN